MAWTPPKTWSDTRDRLNAANLNTYIRDNQLALRADQAALAQRVTNQEAAGYGDPLRRNINVVGLGGANRIRLSNLTPPDNTKLIYLAVRGQAGARWVSVPLIEYAIWSVFTEVGEAEDVAPENRWNWRAAGATDRPLDG